MPKWCQGTIVDKRVWTDGLFTLKIRVPDVEPFAPGQFLHLAMPDPTGTTDAGGEPLRVNRPYSVASPPGPELEFFVVVVPEGELSPRLWALQPEDTLEVSQSGAGRFTLDKSPPAENLWLIATGTGLAPYIAMLRTDQPWQQYQNIVVIHGVRYAADLAYTEELNQLADRYPGRFKLVQSVTRDAAPHLLVGRIPILFENGEIERLTCLTCRPENSTVLLCGNPAMLDSMEALLGAREMKKHRSKSPGQIVLERYW